jgi:hypothetical protein
MPEITNVLGTLPLQSAVVHNGVAALVMLNLTTRLPSPFGL